MKYLPVTIRRSATALALSLFSILHPNITLMSAETNPASEPSAPATSSTLVLGGGCFWCLEAFFQRLEGVTGVTSGYAGGHVKNPTYRQVCDGTTGHAEVVKIHFDPAKTSLAKLFEAFWLVHDPTTLNRQGNDVGPQYRSIILYAGEYQKAAAEAAIAQAAKKFSSKIVTEVKPLGDFYTAENDHQDYFNQNPNQPYCRFVIAPKLDKLPGK
jgi:peptide-methionine (S)-S-oxide reductase